MKSVDTFYVSGVIITFILIIIIIPFTLHIPIIICFLFSKPLLYFRWLSFNFSLVHIFQSMFSKWRNHIGWSYSWVPQTPMVDCYISIKHDHFGGPPPFLRQIHIVWRSLRKASLWQGGEAPACTGPPPRRAFPRRKKNGQNHRESRGLSGERSVIWGWMGV